jgi:hypothetical protein
MSLEATRIVSEIDTNEYSLVIDLAIADIREILSVKSTRSQGSNFAAWLKR